MLLFLLYGCMVSVREQRTFSELFIVLGKTAVDTQRMLCDAYGNEALSETTTCGLHICFQSGRTWQMMMRGWAILQL
jgi:hypothetical protein